MSDAPFPFFSITCDPDRLTALRKYAILDTPNEAVFDEMAQNAARMCQTPIAVINFIDSDRQWFKSEVGLGVKELPLNASICLHALLEEDMLLVPDLQRHETLKSNPNVTDAPHFRFYAGVVLKSDDGQPLGSLCVLDYVPRHLAEEQIIGLKSLARQVVAELTIRLVIKEQGDVAIALQNTRSEHGNVLHALTLTRQSQDRLVGALEMLQEEQKYLSQALEASQEEQSRLKQELQKAQELKQILKNYVADEYAPSLHHTIETFSVRSGLPEEVAQYQQALLVASRRLYDFIQAL